MTKTMSQTPDTNQVRKLNMSGVNSNQWRDIFSVLSNPKVKEIDIIGPDMIFVEMDGELKSIETVTGRNVSWIDEDDFINSLKDVESHAEYAWPFDMLPTWVGVLRLQDTQGKLMVKANFHSMKPKMNDFPLMAIKKIRTGIVTLDSICDMGVMKPAIKEFIKLLIKTKQNIVFSGTIGVGKTTLLEACMYEAVRFDATKTIGIYEDLPEITHDFHDMHDMDLTNSLVEFDGDAKTSDIIIRQARRQHIDRIVIGETRGPEFQYFIDTIKSGFNGSMTTMHANDPKMALMKMTTFLKRAKANASTPITVIEQVIADSVDYIIHLGKLDDGRYRALSIDEVTKVVVGDDVNIMLNPIYKHDKNKDIWLHAGQPTDDHLLELFNKIEDRS